jgi:4-amino-4-deoxy-L-arabinose transferase-like glycosyltransferase
LKKNIPSYRIALSIINAVKYLENILLQESLLIIVCVILLIISFFINLGMQPLFLEEPRRAVISMEMLFRNNLIVPTELGEFYYNKPPLWNWIIILSFKIFGNYSEFTVRFFSVLSLLVTGLLIFFAGKRFVNASFGIYTSLLFLVSIDLYFYYSPLGEIDLFYTLITFSSFICLFVFHEKKNFLLLFLSFYFLSAFGFLTKGLPTIAFAGISLLAYFIYYREFRRLISWQHLTGIVIFMVIITGYFYLYSKHNNVRDYLNELFLQASGRTTGATKDRGFLEHFLIFPFETFKNLLPGAILIVYLFNKEFRETIRENKFIETCMLLFLANILLYWFSPGTRQRYIYMLFPMIISVFTYFGLKYRYNEKHKNKLGDIFTDYSMGIFIALLILLSFSLSIIPSLNKLKGILLLSVISMLILGRLLYDFLRNAHLRLIIFIFAIIILRFIYNFSVIPYRTYNSRAQVLKDSALQIHKITKEHPLYIYKESKCPTYYVYYLEREREEMLTRKDTLLEDEYYITDSRHRINKAHAVIYNFKYDDDRLVRLVKISGD